MLPLEWKGYPEQSKGDAEGNSFCNLERVALNVASNWKGCRLASTGNCPRSGREVAGDLLCHLG